MVYLSHLDSIIAAEVQYTTTPASADYSENCVFSPDVIQRRSALSVTAFVLTVH
jgi:hypothetical protein